MIITYGAYCSDTLDKNYVPVILKYLELYVLTYQLDDILSDLSKNANKTFVKAGSGKSYKIRLESENINEDDIIEISDLKIIPSLDNYIHEQRGTGNKGIRTGNTGNRPQTQTAPMGGRPISGPSQTGPATPPPRDDIYTKAGDVNRGVVSIEPTWIQVSYNNSTFLLGIKVVPIYFSDETAIIKEITTDLNKSKGIKLILDGLKRSVQGWFRRFVKAFPPTKFIEYLGWDIFDRNASQGVKIKNNVIFATTSMKKNVFMILNKNNISIDVTKKSFKNMFDVLKWCSMIFMDDVNQQVSFCMKNMKGSCAVIPYRVLIHSTMNKGMGQAYQDIDEVQSAVTSVFRMNKTRITKLFGEMVAASSVIDVKTHLLESIFLRENSEKYLSNPDLAIDTFKKIRFISKESDIDSIQSKLAKFPTKTPNEIKSFINKNSNNFDKLYNFTKKVLKNSVNMTISENDLEILSYIIAYRTANMRGPNQLPRLRDLLKQFIYDLNKNTKSDVDEKIILFRTIVDTFNKSTSILKYHDFESDKERQEIIIRNLYVFLNLIPLLLIK